MLTASSDERGEPLFLFGSHAFKHASTRTAG